MLMTIRPQMTDYWPNWTRMTELSALESEVLPHVLTLSQTGPGFYVSAV